MPLRRAISAQQREIGRGLLVDRRDAHQPDDRQPELVPALGDEPVRLGRHDPGLLRLLADVDLDQAGRAPPAMLHFLGEGLRQPRPVDALDHVEQSHRVAHLVGL